MPQESFLKTIFFAIYCFKRGSSLAFVQLKLISNFVDDLLASTEFFNDSSVVQKYPKKDPSDLCSSWHCQLFEHPAFVAHLRVRQR